MSNKLCVEFTSQACVDEAVWAKAVYRESEAELPSEVLAAAKKKKASEVLEMFIADPSDLVRHLLIRLGEKEAATRQAREEAGAALYSKVSEGTEPTLLLDILELGVEGLDLICGFLLSRWRFNRHRTLLKENETDSVQRLLVVCSDPTGYQTAFQKMEAMLEGVFYARSLTSEPPNILFPMAYAEKLKELRSLGIEVEVLDVSSLQKIGMTALLAVGQGSAHPPAVAILTWNGLQKDSKPVVLVGKGVCFDSGGLCLKPVQHQHDMKWDKAGAGVVAGAIKALAQAKAPVHVVGVIGLAENMPDGNAVKPGDVIYTMSGQTVEIVNTDAEGRLVLADCLWYAQEKFNPCAVLDFGTLTVETFASLGNLYAGLYTNSSILSEGLKAAGIRSGDWVWELPMGPYFAKQIESRVADMKNVGVDFCGENGAAAEFLKRFIKKDIPWAHLDIAGVSWTKEDMPLCRQGVTGFGVRLLEFWFTEWKWI